MKQPASRSKETKAPPPQPEPPSTTTKLKDFAGNAADLAEWCDISRQTVENLVQGGTFTRVGPNLFALKANNRAFIQKLRVAASGRNSVTEAARGRLIEAKAKQVELKVGELDSKLVYITEVEAHWANALRTFRASALAIPTRVSARVPGLNREVVYEMDQEIREALTEMARNGYPEPSAASVGPAISAPAAESETE
jgi:phage terminase Nu1 subunit (DNA packaging protein)